MSGIEIPGLEHDLFERHPPGTIGVHIVIWIRVTEGDCTRQRHVVRDIEMAPDRCRIRGERCEGHRRKTFGVSCEHERLHPDSQIQYRVTSDFTVREYKNHARRAERTEVFQKLLASFFTILAGDLQSPV